MNRDKEVYELSSAFYCLVQVKDDVYLLIFGHDEESVSDTFHLYFNIKNRENFCYYGATPEPHLMLQAADVFVLPTYGSSVIEASALGLPVICSDAYGVMDAMVEDVTGLRCKVGDVDSLFSAMQTLANDKKLQIRLGDNGRKRVLAEFDRATATENQVKFYKESVGV